MSYDSDEHGPVAPTVQVPRMDPRDLEAITTLIDLAAIYLTDEPGAEFTERQLLDQLREIGGPDSPKESDVLVVLPFMRSLKRVRGGKLRMR